MDPADIPVPTSAADAAADHAAGDHASGGSLELVSQMVDSGLTQAFAALKDKATALVHQDGGQYLAAAGDRLKDSAKRLGTWSRQNPLETAVVVAAVCGVAAYLVASALNDGAAPAAEPTATAAASDDQAQPAG